LSQTRSHRHPELSELRTCWLRWVHIVGKSTHGSRPPKDADYKALRYRLASAFYSARRLAPELGQGLDEAESLWEPWHDPQTFERAERVSLQILHQQCVTASQKLGFLRRKQHLGAWLLAAFAVPMLVLYGRTGFIKIRDFIDLKSRIDWINGIFYDMGTNGYLALMAIGMVFLGMMTLRRTSKS
jgi:hypothetical protein